MSFGRLQRDELVSANDKHGCQFNSPHEAYAVIKEELDEFWDEVKKQKPRKCDMVAELAQLPWLKKPPKASCNQPPGNRKKEERRRMKSPDYSLYQMDCLKFLEQRQLMDGAYKGPFDCIFSDAPDNIDLDYGRGFSDKVRDEVYFSDLCRWTEAFVLNAWNVWISFNAKWTIQMSAAVFGVMRKYPPLKFKPCVQVFEFGQYNSKDLTNCHRPLWRLSWEGACKFPDNIRVLSKRQELGDPRANPDGKIPSSVFDFPRVTGNSKQRRKWCPTQLHEGLVERCIKLSTAEGMTVYDPFAGSGTVLRVCKRINRKCVTTEINLDYVERIAEENDLINSRKDQIWTAS